jgi:hypothetical protein
VRAELGIVELNQKVDQLRDDLIEQLLKKGRV